MRCEYRLWRRGENRECMQRVGVRTWYDAAGTKHAACSRHIAERLNRFPEADPPEPKWLHEDPEYADDMTYAKWFAEVTR
jgi:hypothetical protein